MAALRSMTGFGLGKAPCLGGELVVDVRAVNHRYCDVKVRMPREFNPLEARLLSAVRERVKRGHIEVGVRWEHLPLARRDVRADVALARAYLEAYEQLRRELGLTGTVDLMLLADHEVVTGEEEAVPAEDLWAGLSPALGAALDACVAMRESEGAALRQVLLAHCQALEALRARAAAAAPRAVAEAQARLRERVAELAQGVTVDPARLAQELALLGERADISEELGRIASHVTQVRTAIEAGGAVGRKLDFLCQELHREINTAGSKSQDVELAGLVVEFKVELEKLREQVQNVE
jgi:uncharacterized protein (TIGR00255 family)